MGSRFGRGDRGEPLAPKKRARIERGQNARDNPIYGKIPLIERVSNVPGRPPQRWFEYDLDWQPPLPAGAVRGDPKKQRFCFMCHHPRHYYVDLQ